MAQARRKTRKRGGGSGSGAGLVGAAMLLAGMAIGSLATILWQGARTNDDGVGAGIRQLFNDARQPPTDSTANSSATAQPPPKPSTDFTFFTLLPEIEVLAPPTEDADRLAANDSNDDAPAAASDSADSTDNAQVAAERVAARAPAQYMLQAGSFRREADADRRKATLALQGIVSTIQKVSIQGRGDFFRVRLGPYPTYQAMVQADRRLADAGIKTLRLKMNPG
ncbi:MAG: SPOR domain-containing protein [bacterium]